MLIVLSDVHLGDGTCGHSISADAFHIFADRLNSMALHASWRTDGSYRPIEQIDILLLGDILDLLHSTLWLDTNLGTQDYTRPWTDRDAPAYAAKLSQITRAILKKNAESLDVLRNLTVTLPKATVTGQPSKKSPKGALVNIRLHYMIGNHDWFYGIPGEAFDAIRAEVVDAFGLAQSDAPFPYKPEDSAVLQETLAKYKVYALHGDCYDKFNYDEEKGRINSALGDILTVEMFNRFHLEVERRLTDIPPVMIENLRELTNVRPALATSLWVSSQITHNDLPNSLQNKIKAVWEQLGAEFLALGVVRAFDKKMVFDSVDSLELALQISRRTSFKTINDIALWAQGKIWGGEVSYAEHALKEPAFLNKEAQYIVYGHTHHHEIVSLDTSESRTTQDDQVYFNSGTWHTYFDLAIHKPRTQKFIPYQVVSYLVFYHGDQRQGRRFETISGAYS